MGWGVSGRHILQTLKAFWNEIILRKLEARGKKSAKSVIKKKKAKPIMYILKFFGDILSKDLFLGMLFRGCVWDQLTHFYLAFHWLSKSQPPNCCLLTKAGTHLQGRLINIFTSLSLSGFCLRWRMEVTNELFILLGEEGKWGVWWLSCDLASSLSSWTLVTACTMPGPWWWLWTWLLHFGKSIWGLMVHLTGGKEGHPPCLPWVAGGRKVSVKLEVGAS